MSKKGGEMGIQFSAEGKLYWHNFISLVFAIAFNGRAVYF